MDLVLTFRLKKVKKHDSRRTTVLAETVRNTCMAVGGIKIRMEFKFCVIVFSCNV